MKAKKIRCLVELRKQENKTRYFRAYAILYKGKLANRSISEVIRIIHTEKAATEYILE